MTELIQMLGVAGLLFGTWKLDAINRTLGRIEATLERHKEDIEEHGSRLAQLERDRHPDIDSARDGCRHPTLAQS